MKYIISQSDLPDLKAKMQNWLSTIYNSKYYHKTKKRVISYLSLCNYFYMQNITLTNLIRKYFKGATKSFYRWSHKILTAYYSNNFDLLIFKSTKSINSNYLYNFRCREKICDLYYGYQNIQAGGGYVFAF